MVHIDGESNNSDIHTKSLPSAAHHRCAKWLGLYDAADEAGECDDRAPVIDKSQVR